MRERSSRYKVHFMKLLSILSVVFALVAAIFWAWSAFINVPTIFSGYGTLGTQMPDGSTVIGPGPFYAALTKISRLNAVAAGCAFLSALTQAIAMVPRKRIEKSVDTHLAEPHQPRT